MSNQTALVQFTRTAEHAANQVIDGYSTSFGLATRLLGPRHRQNVRNIYALVRIADELVDGLTAEAGLTPEQQAESLEHFVAETHLALQLGCSSDLVIHAFTQTAREAGIDESLTVPFFESMRADLRTNGIDTTAITTYDSMAHSRYVYGSAEVVGLMCLRVFLRGEPCSAADTETLEHGARQLGAAFQNINFLRDLADDTSRLRRNYLGTTDLLSDSDRLEWVQTIRNQLTDANDAIGLLPRDARAAVRSALALFTALTNRIERTQIEDLYRRRVRVPNAIKLGLATRCLATTWMEPRT